MMSKGWRSYAPCTDKDPAFYIKFVSVNNGKEKLYYEVFLTNYVKLWKRCFTKDDILKIMMDSNKNIEIESEESFIDTGLQILQDIDNQSKKTLRESVDGQLYVALVKISSFVLKMNFTLNLCNAQDFYSAITQPMLLTIEDLKESETELRNIIKKKDFELSEYFRETNPVYSMMKCFTTLKYDDQSHMKKHNVMAKLFGDDEDGSLSVKPKDILKSHRSVQHPSATSSTISHVSKTEPANTSIENKPETILITEPAVTNAPIKTELPINSKKEPGINTTKTEPGINATTKAEPDSQKSTPDFLSQSEYEQINKSQNIVKSGHKRQSTRLSEAGPSSAKTEPDSTQNQSSRKSPKNRVESSQKTTPKRKKKLNY